jgi:hypothetical protein
VTVAVEDSAEPTPSSSLQERSAEEAPVKPARRPGYTNAHLARRRQLEPLVATGRVASAAISKKAK